MLRIATLGTLTLVFAAFCSAQETQSSASGPMITGTVTYLVRTALPPDAAIDIRLEDVSLADAPAKLVAENIFAGAGKQVPIPFQLPYAAADIDSSHRYQVRARVTIGGKLMMTTTQAYPVITNSAPTVVTLVLELVQGVPGGPGPEKNPVQPATASAPLVGRIWKLTKLNGQPPVPPNGSNFAQLTFDASQNRYSGSTGCNRINGAFELDGDSLHFKAGAMTMMACADPLMKQEQALNAALQSVTGYKISGETLTLLAGEKVVATFTAASPSSE